LPSREMSALIMSAVEEKDRRRERKKVSKKRETRIVEKSDTRHQKK